MAGTHPYISSVTGLNHALDYLKKSFPPTFNSETLKKLSIAPGNESSIVNIMRFLNLVSEDDARTEEAHKVFTQHSESEFNLSFSQMIQSAYADLFALHRDSTWTLGDEKLIPFFRQSDKTSELVGTRQANTFKSLSSYSGHVVTEDGPKVSRQAVKSAPLKKPKRATSQADTVIPGQDHGVAPQALKREPSNVGLTVRIEINLPATGDQDTYDKIFKSIRENFLNA